MMVGAGTLAVDLSTSCLPGGTGEATRNEKKEEDPHRILF